MDRYLEPDALEQRVLTFAAIRSGVSPRKVSPMTRLAQDLDIKGDDAEEFFDAYRKEFRVNLDELNMHWDQHFHPEPGLILNTVFWFLGFVALTFFVARPIYPRYWASSNEWQIGGGLVGVISLFAAWYQNRRSDPVTIADLIDAARAGRWVKSYVTRR
jgi:hypothetical protein